MGCACVLQCAARGVRAGRMLAGWLSGTVKVM